VFRNPEKETDNKTGEFDTIYWNYQSVVPVTYYMNVWCELKG